MYRAGGVEGTKSEFEGESVDRTSIFANDQSDVLFPISYSQFSDPIVGYIFTHSLGIRTGTAVLNSAKRAHFNRS